MPPLCSGLACDCFDQRITNSDAVKILGLIFKRISLALWGPSCNKKSDRYSARETTWRNPETSWIERQSDPTEPQPPSHPTNAPGIEQCLCAASMPDLPPAERH